MPKGTKYDIEFKKMIADLFNSKQMTALQITHGLISFLIIPMLNLKFLNKDRLKRN